MHFVSKILGDFERSVLSTEADISSFQLPFPLPHPAYNVCLQPVQGGESWSPVS